MRILLAHLDSRWSVFLDLDILAKFLTNKMFGLSIKLILASLGSIQRSEWDTVHPKKTPNARNQSAKLIKNTSISLSFSSSKQTKFISKKEPLNLSFVHRRRATE